MDGSACGRMVLSSKRGEETEDPAVVLGAHPGLAEARAADDFLEQRVGVFWKEIRKTTASHVVATRLTACPDGLAKRPSQRCLGKRMAEDGVQQQQTGNDHPQEDYGLWEGGSNHSD